MRTRYEFRVKSDEQFFRRFDRDYEMKDGIIQIVSLYDDDPKFKRFVEVYTDYKKTKPNFLAFVRHERQYSEVELAAARILLLYVKQVVEPSGEESGTRYDDANECSQPLQVGKGATCGSGRRQISDLTLGISKRPNVDIFTTIAYGEEWVVSNRFKDIVLDNRLKGCEFMPVEDGKGRGRFRDELFQLIVKDEVEILIPPSFFADDPFTKVNRYQCPKCRKLKGLRLWSELHIEPGQFRGDIAKTRELYGYRKGILMPMPLLVVSQLFYQALTKGNIRGFLVEVAHEA